MTVPIYINTARLEELLEGTRTPLRVFEINEVLRCIGGTTETGYICKTCGKWVSDARSGGNGVGVDLCALCAQRYPPDLVKAAWDPFFYAFGLDTGQVVTTNTSCVNLHGEWVWFPPDATWTPTRPIGDQGEMLFDRGVWVRLDSILWVADAPYGS